LNGLNNGQDKPHSTATNTTETGDPRLAQEFTANARLKQRLLAELPPHRELLNKVQQYGLQRL
ncbi:MAG: hypothetical protein RQ757_11745, partial [Pseudomonadales bacterium]|nr:hypothetical protein [Pseudomonadales bacterium]